MTAAGNTVEMFAGFRAKLYRFNDMTDDSNQQNDSPRKPARRRWPLRAVAILMAMLLVGGSRLAMIQGLVRPVRLVGGSMAEGLVGQHYRVLCGDCGITFRCDADDLPRGQLLVCPNCGYTEIEQPPNQLRRGDRLLIDSLPLAIGSPRRWDVFAFTMADGSETLAVKRVAGLPGERLEIRHGDLYVDGHIVRKSASQRRALAVLVHDNNYRPGHSQPGANSPVPPRWSSDRANSRWRSEGGDFFYEGTADGGEGLDWLTYRHLPCLPPPVKRTVESPPLDSYGYNQNLSRKLNEVTDLTLLCHMSVAGSGCAQLLTHDGRESFQIELDRTKKSVRLLRQGETVATAAAPGLHDGEFDLELALCDRRVTLAIDGRGVLSYAYDVAEGPLQPTSRPLGVASLGATLRVSHLRVYRDIYYLSHLDLGGQPWRLGRALRADEFLVLGDNVPISLDSRLWSQGVERKSLVGKVFKFPGRSGQ